MTIRSILFSSWPQILRIFSVLPRRFAFEITVTLGVFLIIYTISFPLNHRNSDLEAQCMDVMCRRPLYYGDGASQSVEGLEVRWSIASRAEHAIIPPVLLSNCSSPRRGGARSRSRFRFWEKTTGGEGLTETSITTLAPCTCQHVYARFVQELQTILSRTLRLVARKSGVRYLEPSKS